MDKQNYTLKPEKSQEVRQIFSKIKYCLQKKLEESDVIQRRRTVKDYTSLIEAAYLYIIEQLSYQRLALKMAIKYSVTMSHTAWRKRLIKFIPVFSDVCRQCIQEDAAKSNQPYLSAKSPIFALDTTILPVEGGKDNSAYIHTCYSLTDRSLSQTHITDCHTAESVTNFELAPNTLYIADRAYGRTNQMAHMIRNRTHFIFRISPAQVRLYRSRDCKEKISFQTLLSDGEFSMTVYIRSGTDVYDVRLFGSPLPEDKLERALKRAKREAQKKQFERSDASFEYSKWLFLVTSLSAKEAPPKRLLNLYSDRWQIELLFKRAKSLLHFHRSRRSPGDSKKESDSEKEKAHYSVSLWCTLTWLISYIQLAIAPILSFRLSDFFGFSLASYWLF